MIHALTDPDITPWKPLRAHLPEDWMRLAAQLSQETKGSPRPYQAYALQVKYDDHIVGNLLHSWGLPWDVVIAGYLLRYDSRLMQEANLADAPRVLAHIHEAMHYIHYIEEDNLPALLRPPYQNLGALLIAVAIHYAALLVHVKQGSGRLPVEHLQEQIENTGRTLLHITKRLGMWYSKREIEDLTAQLHNQTKFFEDQAEHTRILEQDQYKLEQVRECLMTYYRATLQRPIMVTYDLCGTAGLQRRRQDAHTTATTQNSQLTGFDLATYDIVVPTVSDCYTAFGMLSQLGHIQDRVTDQIANPKPNGYSHIALGLILKSHAPFLRELDWMKDNACTCQLQIATHLMQAIMRYGCLHPSCYPLYTQAQPHEPGVIEPPTPEQFWHSSEGSVLSVISKAIANDFAQPEAPVRAALLEQQRKPIVVYDKNRSPVSLPKGATALDFAYAVDAAIGDHAVEAFINNRKAPLYRQLDAGDIVEMRTSHESQAQDYWLDERYTTTPVARYHINESLKRRLQTNKGYILLCEKLVHYHYKLTPDELDTHLRYLLKQKHLDDELSYLEKLDPEGKPPYTPDWAAQQIIQRIAERSSFPSTGEPDWLPTRLSTDNDTFIPQCLCNICQPRYPHDMKIVGHFRRRQRDLIVHTIHCPRLPSYTASQKSSLVPMTWQYLPPAFKITFLISARDRRGLAHDIARQLRRHQCVVLSLHADAILKFKKAEIRVTIETQDDREVLSIWSELEKVEDVKKIVIDADSIAPTIYLRLNRQREQPFSLSTRTAIELAWEETVARLEPRSTILHNPFDISRPAIPKMFFGRSSEIKKMQRDLCDGDNGKALVLYGPRRSGKSSLCKNFIDRCVLPPYWYAFCSLQSSSTHSEEQILMRIADGISRAFHEQFHLTAYTWWDYKEYDPQLRCKRLIQDCLAMIPNSRLVLILDEFGGALESYKKGALDARFFTFWRNLISETPQLSLTLALPASSHQLLIAGDLSHAFSFTETLPLTFLDMESAKQLLVDPLEEQQIAIHPGAVARASDLTGGNPYYMVLIGLQLIHQLNQEPRKQIIADEDLDLAVQHIIASSSLQNFSFYKSELQNDDELHVLEAIVELTSRTNHQRAVSLKKIASSLEVPASQIRPCLERLRSGLILEEYSQDRSSNPYYSFKIELVRLWLMHNRWFFHDTVLNK